MLDKDKLIFKSYTGDYIHFDEKSNKTDSIIVPGKDKYAFPNYILGYDNESTKSKYITSYFRDISEYGNIDKLELLFIPDNKIIFIDEIFRNVRIQKDIFISKQLYDIFIMKINNIKKKNNLYSLKKIILYYLELQNILSNGNINFESNILFLRQNGIFDNTLKINEYYRIIEQLETDTSSIYFSSFLPDKQNYEKIRKLLISILS